MDRRLFIGGLGATLFARRITAQSCTVVGAGVVGCTIPPDPSFQIVIQNCMYRCWAASLSALFGYHGHPIDQDIIAQTIFQTVNCQSSGGPQVLDQVLSSTWTDSNGASFTASITGLFDPRDSSLSLTNAGVVAELQAGRPLIYCNTSHCMVQVGMKYRKDAAGNVVAVDDVVVADPFPGMGFHSLSASERIPSLQGGQMTYLAAVQVA